MNPTCRDFAKLSTPALGARFVQNLHTGTSAPRKTGYCVIGLGRIAGHFMPAARSTSTSQITGLVSGHRDKAERIAAEYGVPSSPIYNYENFGDIVHNPAIDAVFVALPNCVFKGARPRRFRRPLFPSSLACWTPSRGHCSDQELSHSASACLSIRVESGQSRHR
jgi:hypothetical protein